MPGFAGLMRGWDIMLALDRRAVQWGISAALLCLAALPGMAEKTRFDGDDPAGRADSLWKEGAALHIAGDDAGAVARYRDSLSLYPTARAHTYMARSLADLGRYGEAVEHCRAAIGLDPRYPAAYGDLGGYLIALGRPAEAIPWLQLAAASPGYCCPQVAHYRLGRALLMQGRLDEAAQALETSIAIQPRYPPARRLLESIRARGMRGS